MSRSLPMQRALIGVALIATAASGSAHAGALEQMTPNTIRLLYQKGMYVEFGTSYASPSQSGSGGIIPPSAMGPGSVVSGDTGGIFDSNWNFSGAFKADLPNQFAFLIGFDQPFAGNTTYGTGTFAAPLYRGTSAAMSTNQVTGAVSYDVSKNIRIYGGLRAQQFDSATTVSLLNYTGDVESKIGLGYLIGAGYEIPEIGFRLAMTYYSSISYDLPSVETVSLPGYTRVAYTSTAVTTPQSLQLDFQTGISPKTILFGYVRWVDWTEFNVTPPLFGEVTRSILGQTLPLVKYESDVWTFNLGVGHKLTDRFAVAFSMTYEPKTGDVMPTLAPYDGELVGTLGLSYEINHWNITGGVSYGKLGDAKNDFGTEFDNGSVWGAGTRLSYAF